eukprot:scaffold32967_cov64-Phaeocystis_antarctica.AAC.2
MNSDSAKKPYISEDTIKAVLLLLPDSGDRARAAYVRPIPLSALVLAAVHSLFGRSRWGPESLRQSRSFDAAACSQCRSRDVWSNPKAPRGAAPTCSTVAASAVAAARAPRGRCRGPSRGRAPTPSAMVGRGCAGCRVRLHDRPARCELLVGGAQRRRHLVEHTRAARVAGDVKLVQLGRCGPGRRRIAQEPLAEGGLGSCDGGGQALVQVQLDRSVPLLAVHDEVVRVRYDARATCDHLVAG